MCFHFDGIFVALLTPHRVHHVRKCDGNRWPPYISGSHTHGQCCAYVSVSWYEPKRLIGISVQSEWDGNMLTVTRSHNIARTHTHDHTQFEHDSYLIEYETGQILWMWLCSVITDSCSTVIFWFRTTHTCAVAHFDDDDDDVSVFLFLFMPHSVNEKHQHSHTYIHYSLTVSLCYVSLALQSVIHWRRRRRRIFMRQMYVLVYVGWLVFACVCVRVHNTRK